MSGVVAVVLFLGHQNNVFLLVSRVVVEFSLIAVRHYYADEIHRVVASIRISEKFTRSPTH